MSYEMTMVQILRAALQLKKRGGEVLSSYLSLLYRVKLWNSWDYPNKFSVWHPITPASQFVSALGQGAVRLFV